MANTHKYHPSSLDQEVIRAFAHTTESAVVKRGCSASDFCKKVIDTDIFKNFPEDYTVFVRSPHCVSKMILDELEEKGIRVNPIENEEYRAIDGDAAYWMGYVMMQWLFGYKDALSEMKSIDYRLFYESYDILHTQDVNYAIEFIIEEYSVDKEKDTSYYPG